MKCETHSLRIGNKEYFVHGGHTETLKEFAEILKLKYDSFTPSKLSSTQKIIRVWKIGELSDHLKHLKNECQQSN